MKKCWNCNFLKSGVTEPSPLCELALLMLLWADPSFVKNVKHPLSVLRQWDIQIWHQKPVKLLHWTVPSRVSCEIFLLNFIKIKKWKTPKYAIKSQTILSPFYQYGPTVQYYESPQICKYLSTWVLPENLAHLKVC